MSNSIEVAARPLGWDVCTRSTRGDAFYYQTASAKMLSPDQFYHLHPRSRTGTEHLQGNTCRPGGSQETQVFPDM